MYEINFNQPVHVHFIGIGGISMSGLAEILLDRHFTISGSDWKKTELTDHLESLGAVIYEGQRASNLSDAIDVVVYTAAVHEDNAEYAEAVKRGIPMLSRAQLLGQLMTNYNTAIAVSGTHGKTTTTSMISEILLAAETDPTITVGGILKSIAGNIRVGGSDVFLTEACEYTNSFLSFFPTIGIILNIEADHLDFFKDIDDIRQSFHKFAQKLTPEGLLIVNDEIEALPSVTEGLSCRIVSYGSSADSAFRATNISFNEQGCGSYDLIENGKQTLHIQLSVTGEHNVSNSLAAIAAARELQLTDEAILKGLINFGGTKRRFEYKGTIGGITIIDDYAHHPTEITATLNASKNYPHERLWCVFQPHTYTRTKNFMEDFARALSKADNVVLTDIYAAREINTLGVSSKDLLEEVKKHTENAWYFPSFDETESFLLTNCQTGDLIITMGAGDIVKVGEHLLGE